MLRHHHLGQARQQVAAQHPDIGRGTGGNISRQLRRAVSPVTRDDHGLTNVGMSGKAGFDLAQFDALAADLELMIRPAQEFQPAIRHPPCQIAGAVHAGIRCMCKRVFDEPFGIYVVTLPVSAGHAVATDIKLSGHAHGHGLSGLIQYVKHGVGDGFAQRHGGVFGIVGDNPCGC